MTHIDTREVILIGAIEVLILTHFTITEQKTRLCPACSKPIFSGHFIKDKRVEFSNFFLLKCRQIIIQMINNKLK